VIVVYDVESCLERGDVNLFCQQKILIT